MSMKTADEQNFDQLRQLLALKRHEQPPPGYFNTFSREVIGRIRAGDRGEDSNSAWMFWQVPWLQRFWIALETQPILAGGFAVAVCGFLIAGVIYSEAPDISGPGSDIAAKAQPGMMAIAGARTENVMFLENPAAIPVGNSLAAGSLVPAQTSPSLFNDIERLRPAYINASFPGPRN